jgi:divalent metal cation (Fe/Co/Zn/Cd) transporter
MKHIPACNTNRIEAVNLAIIISLLAKLFLAGLKTSIGIPERRPTWPADGINSNSDIVDFIKVSIFLQLANKSIDKEHPS